MRLLILLFCLTGYLLMDESIAKSESSEFVPTFNCGNDEHFKLCLIGAIPPSTAVTLLSDVNSNICITKTLESFNFSDEMHEHVPATHIDSKRCTRPGQFKLAYLGENVSEYRIINMKQNASESTINKIDSIIRRKGMLKKSEEYSSNALSKKPILYIPISKTKKVYIVQYILKIGNDFGRKYGPLFLYADGKITEIDGEAEITKAFMLNGRFFVLLDHGCWQGCGNIYTILLEIEGGKFRLLFKDGTWAT